MERLRKCPLCGGNGGKAILRHPRHGRPAGPWTVVRCTACGMVYLGQQINYDEQQREFDWADTFPSERQRRRGTDANTAAADSRQSAFSLARTFRRLRRIFRKDRSRKTMAVVYRHKQGGRLCDFGCGTGKLLAHAVERFEVWGVDISRRQAKAARERAPAATILVCPAAEVDLPPASFDALTMQSYIEHESEPLAALRAAWKLLKPGGVVVLKTPNHDCWNRRLRGGRWCGYRFPDHCNYFTPRTLAMAVSLAGFQVLPGPPGDCLAWSDNMYLAAEKPIAEKSNSAEPADQRRLRNSGVVASVGVVSVQMIQILNFRFEGIVGSLF